MGKVYIIKLKYFYLKLVFHLIRTYMRIAQSSKYIFYFPNGLNDNNVTATLKDLFKTIMKE